MEGGLAGKDPLTGGMVWRTTEGREVPTRTQCLNCLIAHMSQRALVSPFEMVRLDML